MKYSANSRHLFILLFSSLMILGLALPMNGNISYDNEIIHNQLSPAHTSHGVISISSNAEFNSTADAE